MLQILYSPGTPELPAPDASLLAALARSTIRTHLRGAGRIQLVLTGDDHTKSLNAAYRGKDYPTDVLSFDYSIDGNDPAAAELELVAGEVYISLDRAREQAMDQRVELLQETARLAVHGLLHLAGYDHDTPEKLHVMEARTDILLQTAGLFPSAAPTPLTALAGGVMRKE